MGADQQDDLGACVVGAGPVDAGPQVIAGAGAAGADIGVGVVPVDAPAGQHPLGEAVLTWPADVVHDLVGPPFLERAADAAGDVVQGLVPAHLDPAALAPGADPFQGVQDAVGVGDLVEGGRSLGAVAAPRAGVLGVALELADLQRLPVHVTDSPARGLPVLARGGGERGAALCAPGPRHGVQP